MSFGEFAAMYVMNWSNAVWPTPNGTLRTFKEINGGVGRNNPNWHFFFHDSGSTIWDKLDDLSDEVFISLALGKEEAMVKNWLDTSPDKLRPKLKADLKRFEKQYGTWFEKDAAVLESVKRFYDGLPAVRWALANVPTYMLADDHEVTDDWNLNEEWQNNVTAKPLGRTILRNALASFVIFQGWGNDPVYWAGAGQAAISATAALLANSPTTPNATAAAQLDNLFGLQADHECKLKFWFKAEGPKHEVIGLDTRTSRAFNGPVGSPALLSDAALNDQIAGTLPAGKEVALFLAPGPVLSPAIIEETVWPALMRIWDIQHAAGTIPVHGYEQWDAEAWAFNSVGFEKFINKLANYGNSVILSGDVHYAAAAVMDYFETGKAQKRIVQFTSSGFKNSFPDFAVALIRAMALTQQLLTFGAKMQRLAWDSPSSKPLNIGPGEDTLPPHLRGKMKRKPTYLPTHGWPQGTTIAIEPDWRWRFNLLMDMRQENERPAEAQLPPAPNVSLTPNGYHQAAMRHIAGVKQLTNSRKVSFASNLGLIRFTGTGTTLKAQQYLYSVLPDNLDADPHDFALHEAAFTPSADDTVLPDIEFVEA